MKDEKNCRLERKALVSVKKIRPCAVFNFLSFHFIEISSAVSHPIYIYIYTKAPTLNQSPLERWDL